MSAELRRCARCGIPETYETVEFRADGVCNVCENHEVKRTVDWGAKKKQLDTIIEQYRGKHPYDAIVPFSGGKDSTFTLLYLMKEYGIKPLVVQCDHLHFRKNILEDNERTFRKLGVEVLHFRPNWHVVKRVMLESLRRRGDACLHCHQLVFAYPMQVAIRYQTPLIIWGEPSAEYTSYSTYLEEEVVDENRFDRFVNLGITAEDMAGMVKHDTNFDFRDFAPFTYPKRAELAKLGAKSICLGSYIPWDVKSQVKRIQDELGWRYDQVEGLPPEYGYEKRECHLQGVRDHLKYLKRGYSRATQMTALDIRNGRMTKEQADAIVREYDGRRPASLDRFLEILGINEDEYNEIAKQTAVPPHVPDFNLPAGVPNHDLADWHK